MAEKKSFAEAFVALQAEIKPAIKDATNPAFRSKYADLGAVWEAVKEPLKTNGFAVIQMPQFEGETMYLETILLHTSGEKMSGRYPLKPMKHDPQGYGSAITYARRYSICAILGVIADEDDDGNAASQRTPPATVTKPVETKSGQYEDPDGQMQAWIDQQTKFLTNCETLADVQAWEESRADAMKRLHNKNLAAWGKLVAFKEVRIRELAKGNKP